MPILLNKDWSRSLLMLAAFKLSPLMFAFELIMVVLFIFPLSNNFRYLLSVGEREFFWSSSSSAFMPNVSYLRFNFGFSGLTVFGADWK